MSGSDTATPAGLPQVSRGIGIALGSTTALSAILFYFGWSRAYYFYDYFGVDSSLLGLTTRDYLQLSVDGLFVPLTVAAAIALAALWAWPVLRRAASARWSRLAGAVAGVLLLLNGLSAIVVRTPANRLLVAAPICLAAGAGLLVSALRAARRPAVVGRAVTEWSVLLVLVGVSLFWAANDYSAAVGRSRAREMAAQLPAFPDATLFSEKSLSLRNPGVREVRCADEEAAFAFRYDGLKLILQSGDVYLLLPGAWTATTGTAVVLPRTDTTRLEFRPSGAAPVPPAATC